MLWDVSFSHKQGCMRGTGSIVQYGMKAFLVQIILPLPNLSSRPKSEHR